VRSQRKATLPLARHSIYAPGGASGGQPLAGVRTTEHDLPIRRPISPRNADGIVAVRKSSETCHRHKVFASGW
jgi:hypothetical protein